MRVRVRLRQRYRIVVSRWMVSVLHNLTTHWRQATRYLLVRARRTTSSVVAMWRSSMKTGFWWWLRRILVFFQWLLVILHWMWRPFLMIISARQSRSVRHMLCIDLTVTHQDWWFMLRTYRRSSCLNMTGIISFMTVVMWL